MNCLLIFILIVNMFAPYIGSWLPIEGGAPVGGLLRDLLIAVFAACTALAIIRSPKVTLSQFGYIYLWLFLLSWMTVLAVMLSDINAGILGARNIVLFPLVGFLLFINMDKGTVSYATIINCIYILAGIAAVLGILDVATKGDILLKLGYKPDYAGGDLFNLVVQYLGIRRASGGLADALNYGYTMALFAIFILYRLLKYPLSKSSKIISYLLIGVLSIATILSLTRGAIIVLAIGFLIFAFTYGSIKLKMALVFSLFIGSTYIASSEYGELLYIRFTDQEKTSAESTQGRITMAEKSIDSILANPLGVGLGTQGAGTKFLNDDARINTDNYFLWIAVESGVIGVLLLLLTLAANFLICFKCMKKDRPSYIYFFILSISFILAATLSSAPISPLYAIFFWIIINIESAVNLKSNSSVLTGNLAKQ
jgi:O-antigen ligase